MSARVSRQRIRPSRLGELPVLVRERTLERLTEAAGADRKHVACRPVANNGVVAKAFDELSADARIHRRHDAQPEPGDARRRERDADHRASQPSLTRVLPHEVCVGDAVGAADFEHPALLEAEVESGKQVIEDVLDGDRLRA